MRFSILILFLLTLLMSADGPTLLAQAISAETNSQVDSAVTQGAVVSSQGHSPKNRRLLLDTPGQRIVSKVTAGAEETSRYVTDIASQRINEQLVIQHTGSSPEEYKEKEGASMLRSLESAGSYAVTPQGASPHSTGDGYRGSLKPMPGQRSSAAETAVSLHGQFPDSTREKVGISPPLDGNNIFHFSTGVPAFSVDFDARHLDPNYRIGGAKSIFTYREESTGPFSSFNPNNIQQGAPAKGPSTAPSDPIAAELQSILHPDQSVQRQ
jgi:hypothetical protein